MIDIHCHILHGIDDGPRSLGESIEMCRLAAADGTSTVVATPHYTPGRQGWATETVRGRIDELLSALRAEKIPLKVLQGADVFASPELPSHPGIRSFLSVNNSRYLLLEFPHTFVPPAWEAFLRSLLAAGVVPVITHPERNEWFIRHPEAVERAVRIGALVQITAMSLLGSFGSDVRACSIHLLKNDLAHVLASDGHSVDERPPVLSEAVKAAAALVGEERARDLVYGAPLAIIENRPVPVRAPRVAAETKRGWLGNLTRIFSRS